MESNDPSRGVFLVVVGNALSGTKSPFSLYSWDGNAEGRVKRFKRLSFHRKMRPKGITPGTIGGRGVIVLVDDAGGLPIPLGRRCQAPVITLIDRAALTDETSGLHNRGEVHRSS
jgi:hypothetical protein